jgi:hypothetical protein
MKCKECKAHLELMKFQKKKIVGYGNRQEAGYRVIKKAVGELEKYWVCPNGFDHKNAFTPENCEEHGGDNDWQDCPECAAIHFEIQADIASEGFGR